MSKPFNKNEQKFIESLRQTFGWTFPRLIAELQILAEADNARRSSPGKPTPEYVTRILRGQRPANETWRDWVAVAFGLTPSTFMQGCSSFVGKATRRKSRPESKDIILPINYWPQMSWSVGASSTRKIAVKLYGLSKTGLRANFRRLPGEWNAPAGFDGYPALRQSAWEQFTANFHRMKKEPPNPEPLWHVSRLKMLDKSTIDIDLMLAEYQDVLVTSSLLGLNKAIRLTDGRTVTVQEWLAQHWTPGNISQPIIPCARQLVVNLLVLTKDREAIIGLQGPDNPDSNGSWATGVSRLVYPKTDSDSYGLPDLEKAASGGCIRELGLPISRYQVKWIAMAAGLKLGSFTFFGIVETEYSQKQILKMFEDNRRSYVERNLGHEVVDIDFVSINAKAVSERLKIENYRPYMELGLVLLLWLQDEATITTG